MSNIQNYLTDDINNFITTLQKPDNPYYHLPAKTGVTDLGKSLNLGFSNFAIKIYYTTKKWEDFDDTKKYNWVTNINEFQVETNQLPNNSFIDPPLLSFYKNPTVLKLTKRYIKKNLQFLNSINYESPEIEIEKMIRAETKQSISTLFQIGERNKNIYLDFPHSEIEIKKFIDSFNWDFPWNAGAHFASLCVFSKTQLEESLFVKNKLILERNILRYLSKETGSYHSPSVASSEEVINGAMKTISGLDWLNSEIHYPDTLIDFCLNNPSRDDGCHITDIVYVFYQCLKVTDHRKSEVIKYLETLKAKIYTHYFPQNGGFSYYLNKSQQYYYGGTITNGENVPDIHGTLLFSWALAMIDKATEQNNLNWRVLKP
jgi:hypothetical protein